MVFENFKEMFIDTTKNFESVSFVGYYEDIVDLLSYVIQETDAIPCYISLELEYEDEYILSVDDGSIWIEKMTQDGIYYYSKSDIIFVDEACDEEVYDHIEADEIVPIFFCDGDCEKCNLEEDEDSDLELTDSEEEIPGFTFSKSTDNGYESYSFYSTDKSLVYKMSELFKTI